MFKDKIEALLAEDVTSQPSNFCSVGNLIEGSFDSESRTAKLVVIKKGWSLNGAYYSDKAIESIANHLNNGAARNVYLDHNDRKDLFKPRKVGDRVAVNMSAVVEDGKVIAKAKFFDSGPNKWIFDRMVEDKQGFGPSITGKAKLRQGEAEGRKGPIVEDVSFLNSYDIVDAPAAGGSIASVSEQFEDKQHLEFIMSSTEEVAEANGLAGRIQKIKTGKKARDEFNNLRWVFMDMIDDLIAGRNEFAATAVKDRKAAIELLLKDFGAEVGKIQLPEPITVTKKAEQIETGIKEVIEELILPQGEKEMEIKSLNDLKANAPLYEAILVEARKVNDASGQVEAWKKDSDELKEVKTKLSESEQKISDFTKNEETTKKEIETLKESVEKFESGVKALQIKSIIEEIKKEAGLADENCSEQFNADLETTVFEDEAVFKEAIKLRVEDRVSLLKESAPAKNKVNGNGSVTPKKGDTVGESKVPTAESLAKKLKN